MRVVVEEDWRREKMGSVGREKEILISPEFAVALLRFRVCFSSFGNSHRYR